MEEKRKKPVFIKPKSRVAHHEVEDKKEVAPTAPKETPTVRATRQSRKRGRKKPCKVSLLLKEFDYELLYKYAEVEDQSMTKLIEKFLNKNGFFEFIQKEVRNA